MPTLVLLRHGQSQWNLENRFTGWWDVDLSPAGITEVKLSASSRAHMVTPRYTTAPKIGPTGESRAITSTASSPPATNAPASASTASRPRSVAWLNFTAEKPAAHAA